MIDVDLINTLILILIDILGFWLALWVYFSNKKAKVNLGLSLMIGTILLWINFYHFAFISQDASISLYYFRIAGASVFGFFIAYYYFIVRWFLERNGFFKYFGYFTLIYGAIFALLTIFTDLVIKNVNIESWGSYPIFSSFGWITFYGYVSLLTFVILVTLLIDYKNAHDLRKRKTKYFLYGLLIFTVLNLLFNVIFQILFNNYSYYQIGNYSTVFLIGFTLYAIVKQGLFDIKVVATKVFTALIWIILLVSFLSSQNLGEYVVNGSVLIFVVIFGVLLNRSMSYELKQKAELEKLTRKLKELDAQKDEFVNVAAHELRAPMTAIKGYISMVLEGDAGKVSSEALEYLADASSSNDRLIRLVNNMLNMNRIEEGRMVFKMGNVKLSDVARKIFSEHEYVAKDKKLDYKLEISNNLSDTVYVDEDRIFEVVSNLINNAIKYTDKGYVEVKLYNPSSSTVKLEVNDSGPGISDQDKKKLFQKFQRAESSAGKVIGSGLGLYITKLLINKFKGKVGMESELGKGSTFWIELPIIRKES